MSSDHDLGQRRRGPAGETLYRSADLRLREEDEQPDVTIDELGERRLQLLEEHLHVDRKKVETGRVRVAVRTEEHETEIDEELERIEAEIKRVPVGEIVPERPAPRETDDAFIIPVVEEVVVVERKLMLKEEVHILKHRHVEHQREKVKLRAQVAEVFRLPPTEPAQDS